MQRCGFLSLLGISWHNECRLNVITLATLIGDKIHFILFADCLAIFICSLMFNNTYVNTKSTNFEFIVNNILHYVVFFLLSEIENGITNAHI